MDNLVITNNAAKKIIELSKKKRKKNVENYCYWRWLPGFSI